MAAARNFESEERTEGSVEKVEQESESAVKDDTKKVDDAGRSLT